MKRLTTMATAVACGCALSLTPVPGHAANWLMLQGTESPYTADVATIWGFVQPEFQQTDGTTLGAGAWSGQKAVFNQIVPDNTSNSQFNVVRARIGVRGQLMPLDSNVNYFLLTEFGNNGITRQGGGSAKVTDASITLNHIPGARIRVGQFKWPGSEEALQAIHVFDYINFTSVTDQLLLERFFNRDGVPACATTDGSSTDCANSPNGPVGAFRDVGLQVFDTFPVGDWEHAYAVMVGNGNGITRGDNDDNKDTYLYWSSEKIYGGEGPRRQGLKLYAWVHDGKRTLRTGGTGVQTNGALQEFNRDRSGLGATYRKDKYRAGFEYIKAKGVIFNGTDGGALPGALNNAGTQYATFNVLPDDEADGYYIDLGYYIKPNWTFDLRYDRLNRGTKTAAEERQFDTLTVGTQWFFNPKIRLLANYEFRDAEAPQLDGSAVPNIVLDATDNRFSIQLLAIY